MKIVKYPDKSSYAVLELGENQHPIHQFTHKINSYEDLWHLNQKIDAYKHTRIIPIVTIPCLIDAQADRRFDPKHSSGLKLVCKFLNGMNAHFKIFHPHNAEVVEALIDKVKIIDNTEFIDKVLFQLAVERDTDNYMVHGCKTNQALLTKDIILMSPDAGAFKPLMKLCISLGWKGETHSASKARVATSALTAKLHQIVGKEDFKGKDILIVDDISVYGGTFKGLAKLLRKANCGKLYLAVSHMTVQNLGKDPVTNYYDKIFTTNSKFDKYCYGEPDESFEKENYLGIPKNLEIIKMF